MQQLAPMLATSTDSCQGCGKKSQLVIQWVAQQVMIGSTGQVTQRGVSRFLLCLWCFRREEFEMDPDNPEKFRSIAVISGEPDAQEI